MSDDKLTQLGTRLNSALEEQRHAKYRAEQVRREWLLAAERVRSDLIDDLGSFAREVGVLQFKRTKTGLTLGYAGRSLEINEDVEGDALTVDYGAASEQEFIVLQPSGEWIYESTDGEFPFIDEGLQVLLERALAIPMAGASTTTVVTSPEAEARKAAEEDDDTLHSRPPGKGPYDVDVGGPGRSGTRGYRKSKDLPPGSVVKPIKGPLS